VGVVEPPGGSLWREVAMRAGLAGLGVDVEVAAEQLWAGLRAQGLVVVGRLSAGSAWDAGVAQALVRQAAAADGALVLLLLGPDDEVPHGWAPEGAGRWGGKEASFVIEEPIDEGAARRWWAALAAEGEARIREQGLSRPLSQLDAWWGGAFRQLSSLEPSELPAAQGIAVASSDRPLLTRLMLAARAWPASKVGALGAGGAGRLLQAGALLLEGSHLVVAAGAGGAADAGEAEADLRAVAQALQQVFAGDAWAHARSAELLARAGDPAGAEVAHVRAISLAADMLARADIWARWAEVVECFPEALRQGCRLRAAELALSRGDADGALTWAERAAARAPGEVGTLLVLGKASLARGDLVTADVTLQRALAAATEAFEQARALSDLAEVRYAQGRLDDAEASAQAALGLSTQNTTTLSARNSLGKLLLARGAWREAEAHFAEDAALAGCLGDTTAQLRARLNRAIAVLSDGRSDEARPMLEAVLVDGEERADERAVAFALSNLAVLAINRHDYGEALELSERAISVRRRLGERLGLSRVIANLAELRLRLGLVDEAEQALSFGRLAVSRGSPLPRTAHFALIGARIQLARSDTLGAVREVATALCGAPGSSDGDMLSECHRVATRIALEDGDVERAARELASAGNHSTSPSAQAECQLLGAMLARASGRPSLDMASRAVTLSRAAGDEELLREAHTLASQVALGDGELDRARSHLAQAALLRDHVAAGLSGRLRSAYLARRDLAVISALEAAQAAAEATQAAAEPAAPDCASRAGTTASAARLDGPAFKAMVGDDPAIRALLEAVRKVGRSEATVLIFGESGTGKELVAEALHQASPRRDAPLVKVNCAALVESLLLSELFGHEKGAFTGAVGRKRGRFEMAEGGTLFLDEIGDISPGTQVALLRVLQERTYERVGGTTPLRANVRVVCATNRDLRTLVERGEFRQDLYFRLTGIVLNVPSLRSRVSDLPALSRALLVRIAAERSEPPKTLSAESISLLARYRWPGNVRELENALRAASLFADGSVIEPADILGYVEGLRDALGPASERRPSREPPREAPPEALPSGNEADELCLDDDGPLGDGPASGATETVYAELKAGRFGLFDLKRQLERDCIARALAETRGNITRAASILGMKRPRLSQLVKQYGLANIAPEGS
jgi:transcriptional regulator with GAF, ATPase, and Fis domain